MTFSHNIWLKDKQASRQLEVMFCLAINVNKPHVIYLHISFTAYSEFAFFEQYFWSGPFDRQTALEINNSAHGFSLKKLGMNYGRRASV